MILGRASTILNADGALITSEYDSDGHLTILRHGRRKNADGGPGDRGDQSRPTFKGATGQG